MNVDVEIAQCSAVQYSRVQPVGSRAQINTAITALQIIVHSALRRLTSIFSYPLGDE